MKFQRARGRGRERRAARAGSWQGRRSFQAPILHAKDVTGQEIERALLAAIRRAAQCRDVREPFAIRPLDRRLGYVGFRGPVPRFTCSTNRSGQVRPLAGPVPVLSDSEAAGRSISTPPTADIATGDGVAMAYPPRPPAYPDMEFHPVPPDLLYHARPNPSQSVKPCAGKVAS